MKKRYYLLALFGLGIWLHDSAYAQLQQDKIAPVNGSARQFAEFAPHAISPNLQHQHDGEHCVTDALTEEWIQT